MGAILKILFPVNLNDITCAKTDNASKTKIPPIIVKISSCFVATAIAPIVPPMDKEPVSPIKTIAGGALNHKNPKPAPISAAQIITSSPVSLTYGIYK